MSNPTVGVMMLVGMSQGFVNGYTKSREGQ